MSEATQQDEIDVQVSGSVEVPVENACPECGADAFAHEKGPETRVWGEVMVDGTIDAYRNDEGDPLYRLTFECLNCGHEFKERGLTGDDIEVTEDNQP